MKRDFPLLFVIYVRFLVLTGIWPSLSWNSDSSHQERLLQAKQRFFQIVPFSNFDIIVLKNIISQKIVSFFVMREGFCDAWQTCCQPLKKFLGLLKVCANFVTKCDRIFWFSFRWIHIFFEISWPDSVSWCFKIFLCFDIFIGLFALNVFPNSKICVFFENTVCGANRIDEN